jgi:hypothetical protein
MTELSPNQENSAVPSSSVNSANNITSVAPQEMQRNRQMVVTALVAVVGFAGVLVAFLAGMAAISQSNNMANSSSSSISNITNTTASDLPTSASDTSATTTSATSTTTSKSTTATVSSTASVAQRQSATMNYEFLEDYSQNIKLSFVLPAGYSYKLNENNTQGVNITITNGTTTLKLHPEYESHDTGLNSINDYVEVTGTSAESKVYRLKSATLLHPDQVEDGVPYYTLRGTNTNCMGTQQAYCLHSYFRFSGNHPILSANCKGGGATGLAQCDQIIKTLKLDSFKNN